jgi:hypothetical protein
MAIKIIGLNPIVTQSSTDLYEVSLNGLGSRKETRAQMQSWMQNNLLTPEQIIYVTNSGSDVSGNGSALNSYATLSYALSSISPSSSTPYLILMQGVFTETNVALKPWVAISGNDSSSLHVTGSVTLDSSWSSSGELTINHFYNIEFPATVTLDFNAAGAAGAVFNFSNNLMSGACDFSVVGDSTTGTILLFENNVNFASTWNITVTNCYGAIDGGDTGNVTINHSSETAGGNFNVINSTIEGNFSLNDTTTSAGMSLFHEQCKVIGNTTYASNGSALIEVFAKGMTYFNAPTLDYGTSGGAVQFFSDYLTQLPALLNGAGYEPNTIADAVKANYYFNPVNFTGIAGPSGQWVADSVTGFFAGIDAALASVSGGSPPQLLYLDSANGNDSNPGTIQKPFQTYPAAAAYAVSNGASITTPFAILPAGIVSQISGDLVLYPFVDIIGQDIQTSQLSCTGNIVLDASFDSVSTPKCIVSGCKLSGSSISLSVSAAQSQQVLFKDIDYTSISTVTLNGSGLGSCLYLFQNCLIPGPSPAFTSTNAIVAFQNSAASGVTSIGNSSTGPSQLFFYNNPNPGAVYIQNTGSGSSNLVAFSTPITSGLTLDGNSVTAQFDSTSYCSVPSFLNGASFSNITLSSLADGVQQSTFSPVNYVPTNNGGADPWSVSSVTANLAGIDLALGSLLSANIPQIVWANSLTGNDLTADGSMSLPFQTYGAAASFAAPSANANNPYSIELVGNFNESGMVLYPFVNVHSNNTAMFYTAGTVTADSSWNSVTSPFCRVQGFILSALQVDITFTTYQGAELEFDVDWGSTPDIQIHGSNTTAPEKVSFFGRPTYSGEPIEYEMYSVNPYFENIYAASIILENQSTVSSMTAVIKNCQAIAQLFMSTSGSQDLYTEVFDSPQIAYIDIQDNQSYLTIDSTSYTVQPTLAGTATLVNINIISLSDGVNCSTYSPVHFTPIPSSAYGANSLSAYIAGIDSALATVIPGTPIAQQLWVNTASGNDSHAGTMPDNALATYDVGAYPIVFANASPTNPYVVNIIGPSAVTSNFNILPYCTVNIIGGLLTVPGQINLDASYASANNTFSYVYGQFLASGGVSLDYGAGDGNLVTLNVDPTTTPSISATSPGGTGNNGVVISILPNADVYAGVFNSSVSFQNLALFIQNFYSYANVTLTSLGSGNCSIALQSSSLNTKLTIDGTGGAAYFQTQNTYTQSLEVITTNAEGDIFDDQSYPMSLILSGGAIISQIGILGSTDGLAFSTTFSPVNFSLVGGNWPSTSLTAALAGIDAQLATSGGGDLQDAYNAGTPGSQGLINLTTDNLNPFVTANSVRGSGSTLQRHFDAFNTVPITGGLGFWGYAYSGYNSSLSKVDYATTAAFATTTTAGSETATWSLIMMQSGSAVTALHVNAAAQEIDTPYEIVNPAGAQTFNTSYNLNSSLTYSGQLLGYTAISDDASAYTVTINSGGFSLNSNDCFYIQTQGTNTVTITPSGGATINGNTSSVTVPLYTKATVQLVNNSSKAWVVTYESPLALISSAAFPFTWDSGNSANLTTTSFVTGSYIVCGDYVTANLSILVYPTNNNATVAFTAPLVASGAFPVANVVSMTANLSYQSAAGGSSSYIGNATNQPASISGTNSISVPFYTGGSSGFYMQLNMSFSYKFQNF